LSEIDIRFKRTQVDSIHKSLAIIKIEEDETPPSILKQVRV